MSLYNGVDVPSEHEGARRVLMIRGGVFGQLFKPKKKPQHKLRLFFYLDPGDVLLSHGNSHTTIGDATFHF